MNIDIAGQRSPSVRCSSVATLTSYPFFIIIPRIIPRKRMVSSVHYQRPLHAIQYGS